MSATCCCTELPQKLLQQFRVAPLFALSIQPYKIAATASNVVDPFAKCSVLASLEVEGLTHFMPRMVSVPACTNFHTKRNDGPTTDGVDSIFAVFIELTEMRLFQNSLPMVM